MDLVIKRDSFTEDFLRKNESRFTFKDTLLDYDKYKNITPEVLRFRFDLGEISTSIWLGTGECILAYPADFDNICDDQISFYTYFLRPGLDGIAAFFYALSQNYNYIQLHMVEDMHTDAYLRAEKIKGTNQAVLYADYYSEEMSIEKIINVNNSIEQFRNDIRKYVLRETFHDNLKHIIRAWVDGDDDIDWFYHEIRGELLTWRNICKMNWLFDESEKQDIKLENYLTTKQMEEIIRYQKEHNTDILKNGHLYYP